MCLITAGIMEPREGFRQLEEKSSSNYIKQNSSLKTYLLVFYVNIFLCAKISMTSQKFVETVEHMLVSAEKQRSIS